MSPEELNETWTVGANAGFDGVDLRECRIALDCFFVAGHVEGQGILLAVIPLEHASDSVRLEAKLMSLGIVGSVTH
jgi:hypothetical protein